MRKLALPRPAVVCAVIASLALPSFALAQSQEKVFRQAIALYEQVLNDPNASPEAKDQAQEGIAEAQQDLENLRSLDQRATPQRGYSPVDPHGGYVEDDSTITSSNGRGDDRPGNSTSGR